jgi:hypothetical protein
MHGIGEKIVKQGGRGRSVPGEIGEHLEERGVTWNEPHHCRSVRCSGKYERNREATRPRLRSPRGLRRQPGLGWDIRCDNCQPRCARIDPVTDQSNRCTGRTLQPGDCSRPAGVCLLRSIRSIRLCLYFQFVRASPSGGCRSESGQSETLDETTQTDTNGHKRLDSVRDSLG